MIEKHWEGIAAYSKTENKVLVGFCRGVKQQDTGNTTALLRTER